MNLPNFSQEVRIENCTICNYSCKFCPHSTKAFTRKKTIMDNKLFEFLLTKVKYEAPQITDCTISGFGEPFLDQGIVSKIKIATNLGFDVRVVTNGSVIPRSELIELSKNEKFKSIRFSLHTVNSDNYYKITGANMLKWSSVITNIKEAIKLGIDTIITADVIEENKDDVDELVNYFKDFPVTIEVWKPHNWVDWGDYRSGEPIKNTCGRPFNGPLQIQVDGTIKMCRFDFNGKLLLGDLKIQSLKEIFSSDNYNTLYFAHKNGILEETDFICKDCDQRKDNSGVVIYNNKFTEEERLGRI